MAIDDVVVPRKTVIVGAGIGLAAAAVAACSSGSTPGSSSSAPSESAAAPSGSSAAQPSVLAATADVPVGSGVIVGDVVVTQPVAGQFTGLSATCPHAGCKVNAIADGLIDCPCHGSQFRLDGSVAKGPATRPLGSVAVAVQGGSVVKA